MGGILVTNDCAIYDDLRGVRSEIETWRTASFLAVALAMLSTAALLWMAPDDIERSAKQFPVVGIFLATVFLGGPIALSIQSHSRLRRFQKFSGQLSEALNSSSSSEVKARLSKLSEHAKSRRYLRKSLDLLTPRLHERHNTLLGQEIRRERQARIAQLCDEADNLVKAAARRQHEAKPEVRARIEIKQAIAHLRQIVAEADKQFEEELNKRTLKWWRTLTRNRSPIKEIENQISILETALDKLEESPALVRAEADYLKLQRLVEQRIATSRQAALNAIPEQHLDPFDPDRALALGLFAGSASIPISVAIDLENAENVFDALRDVNSNYAEMSDLEIWHETLVMPAESLVGLASLTKGAYFEELVELEMGGERFADFNHPDTDITIDGIAYQIKATDSSAYVDSVADHIPIIATSEVAEETKAIDIGVTDADLSTTIDLALGGEVIDFGDTILDGVTIGLGGVGIVAIIHGAHRAWGSFQSNKNALGALGVGLKTTSVSTLRSAVNLSEMIYRGTRAIVSAPVQLAAMRRSKGIRRDK